MDVSSCFVFDNVSFLNIINIIIILLFIILSW